MSSRLILPALGGVLLLVASPLAAEPANETVEAVVARKDIPAGTVIKDSESLFKKVRIPKELDLTRAVRDLGKLKGMTVIRALDQNQIVTTRDVVLADGLLKALEPGYRAMTVKVTVNAPVAGFLLPGSRVDVILTMKGKDKDESKVFLENIQVLAISTEEKSDKEAKVVPGIVTLAVKPEQAEKLNAATRKGTLSLVLRKPDGK
jgi:pilus assembly protein CpaB